MTEFQTTDAQRRANACIRRERYNKLAVATMILAGFILGGMAIAISAIRVP